MVRKAQISVDDGNVGVVSPLYHGADEATVKSRSNSPPRHKKKGLVELGVSCLHPRRSVRLSVKHPQAGSLVQYREGSSPISTFDTDIRICNSRLCDPVNVEEPDRLWVAGKQVGLFCRGEEKEVVMEYGRIEACDSEVMMESKLGDNNVLS